MERKERADSKNTSTTVTASSLVNDYQTPLSEGNSTEPQQIAPKDESREGGRLRAWGTVIAGFLLQMTGFGYASSFGVFQDFYVRKYLTRNTSSQISWIGSVQMFLMLTMGIFTGRLFDKGYCYHLIYSGPAIQIFSLFMLSLAQPEHYYQVFLAQGLGVGIGAGLTYAPSVAVMAQHFRDPSIRVRALGIVVAGVSIGGLVHPIFLNSLLLRGEGIGLDETRRSFQRGTRASAGLVAGLQIIGLLLFRTRYPKVDAIACTKESGGKETTETKPTDFKSLVRKFATDWPYTCFVIGMTLYEIVFFFPLFYIQLYSIQQGLDRSFAFYSVSIINAASFIGRNVPGFFSRVVGIANMLLIATAVVTAVIFCMLAVQNVAGVAIFAAMYGLFSGAFISLMSPMLVLLAESPAEIGARMGVCFTTIGFGSLTGTPIAGALLTSKYIWWRPIVFSGCICVMGYLLFIGCRVLLGRRKGGPWVI